MQTVASSSRRDRGKAITVSSDTLQDAAAKGAMLAMMAESSVCRQKSEPTVQKEWSRWRNRLEGCESCVIFCHGGCADGLGAARLVECAFQSLGLNDITIIELEQTDRASKGAPAIRADTAVLYVDISPYEEDIPLLEYAKIALVIDHHKSVIARVEHVKTCMPSLLDLSYTMEHHCACSLVGHHMKPLLENKVTELDRKIAILRKKDVWEYPIDTEWSEDAVNFTAFVQTVGTCSLTMVDEFLFDITSCLAKGRVAADEQLVAAKTIFDRMKCVGEATQPIALSIFLVELHEDKAYNTRRFSKLCEIHVSAIILRANLFQKGEFVNVRVSRTSDDVPDLGALCERVWKSDQTKYGGGGGHPFAAGLQVKTEFWDIEEVVKDMFQVAGITEQDIKFARTINALDLAETPELAQPSAMARSSSDSRLYCNQRETGQEESDEEEEAPDWGAETQNFAGTYGGKLNERRRVKSCAASSMMRTKSNRLVVKATPSRQTQSRNSFKAQTWVAGASDAASGWFSNLGQETNFTLLPSKTLTKMPTLASISPSRFSSASSGTPTTPAQRATIAEQERNANSKARSSCFPSCMPCFGEASQRAAPKPA